MSNRGPWSKERTDQTRELLEDVPMEYFAMQIAGKFNGCIMENLEGKYGYLKIEDALESHFVFYDMDTNELLADFGSDVEAVLKSDWRISS